LLECPDGVLFEELVYSLRSTIGFVREGDGCLTILIQSERQQVFRLMLKPGDGIRQLIVRDV